MLSSYTIIPTTHTNMFENRKFYHTSITLKSMMTFYNYLDMPPVGGGPKWLEGLLACPV